MILETLLKSGLPREKAVFRTEYPGIHDLLTKALTSAETHSQLKELVEGRKPAANQSPFFEDL